MYDNTELSKRVMDYLAQDPYKRSQAVIARMIGYRSDTFNRYVLGKRKMPMEAIQRLCKLLDLDAEEEYELLELAGYQRFLFSRKVAYFQPQSIETIARHLYEWKIIHSQAQALLFSTDSIVGTFEVFRIQPSETNAYQIEDKWFKNCEPKSKRIRRSIQNLSFVRHSRIEELFPLLEGQESVVQAIQNVRTDKAASIRYLQSSIYALVDALRELLILADVYISQIAEELMSVQDKSSYKDPS